AMAIGVSAIQYPEQPDHPVRLTTNDCYYLVRLHEAQAVFQAGLFSTTGALACSTTVKSSFLEGGEPAQSLHQVAAFQKSTPGLLGLGTNLTDWLPARDTDSLRVTIKFSVFKDNALKNLLERLDKNDLVSKV